MIKKRAIALLSVLIFCCTAVKAAEYRLITSEGVSAYHIGLSGIDGFLEDAHAVFDNPAGLDRIPDYSLGIFSIQYPFNWTTVTNVAGAFRLPWGVVGIGYMEEVSPDNPDTRDFVTIGDPATFFTYRNALVNAAYAAAMTENLNVGAVLSYYFQKWSDISASGWGLSAGAVWDWEPVEFAVSLRNILPGAAVTYSNGGKEALPFSTSFSAKYDWSEFAVLGEWQTTLQQNGFSINLRYQPEWLSFLTVSGGWKTRPVIDRMKATPVVGLGLDLGDFRFDYAFEQSDLPQAANHYFSFTFTPSGAPEKADKTPVAAKPAEEVLSPAQPLPPVLPEQDEATASSVMAETPVAAEPAEELAVTEDVKTETVAPSSPEPVITKAPAVKAPVSAPSGPVVVKRPVEPKPVQTLTPAAEEPATVADELAEPVAHEEPADDQALEAEKQEQERQKQVFQRQKQAAAKRLLLAPAGIGLIMELWKWLN